MKTSKTFTKQVAVAILTTVALQGCGQSPSNNSSTTSPEGSNNQVGSSSDDIFSDADAEAVAQVQSDDSEKPSVRQRMVKVNFGVLKRLLHGPVTPSTLKLNLFDDRKIEIAIENVEVVSDSNYVISGHIVGDDDSAVTLVMNNGVLVANIKHANGEENFEVRYAANGVHIVSVPDAQKEGDLGCEEVPAPESAGDAPMIDDGTATAQAAPVIDMLVAYTPGARSSQGGVDAMRALIQMGIADTNKAFTDSGVNLQVRLVGTLEVKSNETGAWSSDLSALKSKTDSRWNEVHAERTRLGADQVTLIANYSGSGTAGIGYIGASASSAFTIVKRTTFGRYTFSHELGHNIGLQHSNGYENSAGRFRTIMAYGTYSRIRRYSNPNLKYNGYATGTSSKNSAAILNSKGSTTAGLYVSKVTTAADVSVFAPDLGTN